MVKGNKVDFGLEAINAFFELNDNEILHAIFKNLTKQDMQDVLKRVAWPGTKWDRTPTREVPTLLAQLEYRSECLVGFR